MMTIMGPYPNYQAVLVLPNPQKSNSRSLVASVNYYKGMDGTQYSYVRDTDEVRLEYQFQDLTKGKYNEFRQFLLSYSHSFIRVIDFEDNSWLVKITNHPISAVESREQQFDFTLVLEGRSYA